MSKSGGCTFSRESYFLVSLNKLKSGMVLVDTLDFFRKFGFLNKKKWHFSQFLKSQTPGLAQRQILSV